MTTTLSLRQKWPAPYGRMCCVCGLSGTKSENCQKVAALKDEIPCQHSGSSWLKNAVICYTITHVCASVTFSPQNAEVLWVWKQGNLCAACLQDEFRMLCGHSTCFCSFGSQCWDPETAEGTGDSRGLAQAFCTGVWQGCYRLSALLYRGGGGGVVRGLSRRILFTRGVAGTRRQNNTIMGWICLD